MAKSNIAKNVARTQAIASHAHDEWAKLVSLARKKPDYAKLLCTHIAGMIQSGQKLPTAVNDFLSDALLAIADGKDAGTVLGTKDRNRPGTLKRDIAIAVDYWRKRANNTVKAEYAVSSTWGLKPDRVKKIATKYKDNAHRRIVLEEAFEKIGRGIATAAFSDERQRLLDDPQQMKVRKPR